MMAVTHIRHGSTDPFADIAARLPTSSHKVPRKRKCTINVTYLRQKQSNISLQEADIFVQIFSWRRGKDLWWGRLRGRWGCFAEWLRVWCGVQWWRREDTADSFSCFLQPLASSLKHMVVLTEKKRGEHESDKNQGRDNQWEQRKEREFRVKIKMVDFQFWVWPWKSVETGQLTMSIRLIGSSSLLWHMQSSRRGTARTIQVKLKGNAPSRAEKKKA